MGEEIRTDEDAAALLDTAARALDNIRLDPTALSAYPGWDDDAFRQAAALLRDVSLVIRDHPPIGAPLDWRPRNGYSH